MRLFGMIFMLLSVATPVVAQEDDPPCDELWFARNLLFDRAGFCFDSTLGQAAFDNADCTTAAPALDARAAANVARLRAAETAYGCAIDTRRTRLRDQEYLAFYRDLQDLPVVELYPGGCIGYRGAPIPLRSGASDSAPVIGTAAPGQSLGLSYQDFGDWTFVTVHPRDTGLPVLAYGWARLGPDPLICDVYPG